MENTTSAPEAEVASRATDQRKLRRTLVAAGTILGLAVIAACVSIATLNSDWLRGKLQVQASAAMQADLQLEDIRFSPFRGAATLTKIALRRTTDDADLAVDIDRAEVAVSVWGLIFRQVNINELELFAPQIVAVKHRLGSEASADTVDKLKRWINKDADKPSGRQPEPRRVDWRIGNLRIHDGAFDYTSVQEGRPPFRAKASSFQYTATDISMSSLYRMLYGADVQSEIAIGAPATLDKRGSAKPATCRLSGVDVAMLDRLFDQSDALAVAGGTMNFDYTLGDASTTTVRLTLNGLQLDRNPEAANQEFMFIPVERIVSYVEEKGGHLELSFTLAAQAMEHSEDLEMLASEFWKGMWIAILKEASPASADELVEVGKKRALEILKNRKTRTEPDTAPAP